MSILKMNQFLYQFVQTKPKEVSSTDRKKLEDHCRNAKLIAVAAIVVGVASTTFGVLGLILAIFSGIVAHDMFRMADNVEKRLSGEEDKVVDKIRETSKNLVRDIVGRRTLIAKHIPNFLLTDVRINEPAEPVSESPTATHV